MEQKMINLTIDNIPVTVPDGTTVLEAARSAGIKIPSLCFLKDVNEIGSCRICVVEVKGARSLMASCVYPVSEGMEVKTNTPRVRHSRQLSLELILSNHRMDCLTCSRNAQCELRQLAADLGIDAVRYANDELLPRIEDTALHLVRDVVELQVEEHVETAALEHLHDGRALGVVQRHADLEPLRVALQLVGKGYGLPGVAVERHDDAVASRNGIEGG